MSLPALLARTYVRYVIPLTVLSVLAFSPLVFLALRVPVPGDVAQVKGVIRTVWLLAALSLAPMLVLVGGVAPAVRSIANGARAGQLAVLRDGAVALVGAAVPVAIAVLAVLIGSLALVVPGLVVLVLLALTGATGGADRDLAARLAASATTVRGHVIAVVGILGASIAVTIVAIYLLQRGLPMPLPKAPRPEVLATFRWFARYAIAGLALLAPLPAIALAAIATRAAPSART